MKELDQRTGVRAGAPRKPATRRPALPCGELLRVDVRERRDPEVSVADQLGEDATGTEGDERAEDRSWTMPARSSAPPLTIGCTSSGTPIRFAAARSVVVAQV